MSETITTLVNVSGLGVFAVQWAAESGNEYLLINPHDTVSLILGCRPVGRDNWANRPVVDPSRFGMTRPPRSFAEFRKIADEFVNGDQDSDQDKEKE